MGVAREPVARGGYAQNRICIVLENESLELAPHRRPPPAFTLAGVTRAGGTSGRPLCYVNCAAPPPVSARCLEDHMAIVLSAPVAPAYAPAIKHLAQRPTAMLVLVLVVLMPRGAAL